MRKILILVSAVIVGLSLKAASFNWLFMSPEDAIGGTVYLVAGDSVSTFSSLAALKALNTVTDDSLPLLEDGGGMGYATGGASSTAFDTSSKFYAVVVNSEGTQYWTSGVLDATGFLYSEGASSPGEYNLDFSGSTFAYKDFTGGGTGGDGTPEPTSGLLMIVGGALLALHRKQK